MALKTPSLRQEIDRLTDEQQLPILLIMFAFWIVCAVEWTQRLFGAIPDPRFWTLLSLIVTIYSGFQVFRLRSRVRLSQGASGEREVARILQQIRYKGFVAFHNLPGIGRNIDHVVVGPSGIYAIETKSRGGSGTIDYRGNEELVFAGRIKDALPLRHARGSASTVQSQLNHDLEDSYAVQPLVVFLGDWDVCRHKGDFTVDVTTADKLVEYFDLQQPALTGKEIAAISSCFEGAAAA